MAYGNVSFTMATPFLDKGGFLLTEVVLAMARMQRDFAPLRRITSLHFASFGLIQGLRGAELKRSYLLFFSLFDGSADAYLADFSKLVPDEIDSMWGHCVSYPGARAVAQFVHWLGMHALDREKPTVPGGAVRYEFHGYRVDPAAEPSSDPQVRRLAPLPLVQSALALIHRLDKLPRRPLPTREALQRIAAETL